MFAVTTNGAVIATVDWLSDAAVKLESAAQFAVRLQVPVPLVMVTVVPLTEQAPLALMLAVVLALVGADTLNVVP